MFRNLSTAAGWRQLDRAPSSHLNLVRTLAAFAVVSHHLRDLFWVNYGRVQLPMHLSTSILYFFTGLGRQAVIIFFVLSGFFISATILKHSKETWCAQSYAIDRLSRLYVVLIPALLLGSFCDSVSRGLPGANLYFFRAIEHFEPPFETGYNLKTFFGNLFFLQNTFVPAFGSNRPLWSLANEFWYYVFGGLLGIAILERTRARLLATVLLMTGCLVISSSIWMQFPIWLMGAAVHWCPRLTVLSKTIINLSALAASVSLLIWILYLSKKAFLGYSDDYLVAIAFTLFLYIVLHCTSETADVYEKTTKFFADFSFSLYATHFPLLILIRVILWKLRKSQPSAESAVVLFAVLTVVVLAAYLFSLYTERLTGSARNVLRKFLRNRSTASSVLSVSTAKK